VRQSLGASVALTLGAAGVIALATGCTDQPTGPPGAATAPAEVLQSLNLDAEARGQLRAALLFAGTQSMLALQQREAGDQVAAAFARLAERVEADDAAGTKRALAAARHAVERYREVAGADEGSAAAADLAAMDLTLERASELASDARALREERQP
jgi:hypothetical protein